MTQASSLVMFSTADYEVVVEDIVDSASPDKRGTIYACRNKASGVTEWRLSVLAAAVEWVRAMQETLDKLRAETALQGQHIRQCYD